MRPRSTHSWALVTAVQRGEMAAFGELYRLHAPTVRRFLRSRATDLDLIEDLTSETFLRALRHITGVADQGKDFEAWLFTIARNALFDQRKRAWVQREIAVADFEQHLHPVRDLEADHIDVELTTRELANCLRALSKDQRRCIALRIVEDKSVKATAETMNRSPEAVRALHHRAIRQLRAHITHATSASVAAVGL